MCSITVKTIQDSFELRRAGSIRGNASYIYHLQHEQNGCVVSDIQTRTKGKGESCKSERHGR